MTTRTEVATYARTLIGVPFHHQGFNAHGLDCAGLIANVGLRFGFIDASWLTRPDCHNYSRQANPRVFSTLCEEFLERKPDDAITLADILIMRFQIEPMHLAIASSVDPLYVVHALTSLGRVAEHRIDATWQARIMRVYGYRGIGDV